MKALPGLEYTGRRDSPGAEGDRPRQPRL